MGIIDHIVLTLIFLAVVLAFLFIIRKKKNGRCVGCSGDCAHCQKNNKK